MEITKNVYMTHPVRMMSWELLLLHISIWFISALCWSLLQIRFIMLKSGILHHYSLCPWVSAINKMALQTTQPKNKSSQKYMDGSVIPCTDLFNQLIWKGEGRKTSTVHTGQQDKWKAITNPLAFMLQPGWVWYSTTKWESESTWWKSKPLENQNYGNWPYNSSGLKAITKKIVDGVGRIKSSRGKNINDRDFLYYKTPPAVDKILTWHPSLCSPVH